MAEILPHPHANAAFFCNAVGPGLLQGNLHFARQFEFCSAISLFYSVFLNSVDNLTMKKPKPGKTKMKTFLPWYSRFQTFDRICDL